MELVTVKDLKPNEYRLGANVTKNNIKIVKAGMIIDERVLKALWDFEIPEVYVTELQENSLDIDAVVDNDIYLKIRSAIKGKLNLDNLQIGCKLLTDRIISSPLLTSAISSIVAKKSDTDNIIEHSIATAVYTGVIAAASGKDKTAVNDYVLAGVLHDIGKTVISDNILFSDSALTPEQKEVIKQHPLDGYNILKEYSWIKSIVRVGVLEHHENIDGTGYPHGLADKQLHDVGKVLHIADVYDALVRSRSYKPGWQPRDAYEYIIKNSGRLFSPKYVNIFKDNVPIYETGTLIRLTNDELAVVIRNTQKHILTPVVLPIKGGKEIDLSKSDLDVSALIRI